MREAPSTGLGYLGPVEPRESQISEPDGVERLLEAGRSAVHTISQFLTVQARSSGNDLMDSRELTRLERFVVDHLRNSDVQALLSRQPALRDPNHPGISTSSRLRELLKMVSNSSITVREALRTNGLGDILQPAG